jgi:hypothetical protein
VKRSELPELHYICAIDNVKSILARGLLSHKRAAKVEHHSVAMPEIQERRKGILVPGARPLHEYVNLYINGRNKMMYKVRSVQGLESVCVLRIDTAVLDLPGTIVVDQNASSGYARFAPAPKGLTLISKDEAFAEYWHHPDDPIESMRHGSVVCAEILVPDRVDPKYVSGIYVKHEEAAATVRAVAPSVRVTINRYLFFGPRGTT